MRLGPVPVGDAEGAILAHTVRHDGGVLRKGRTLSADDIAALLAAGIAEVTVARLSVGDVHEDAAAAELAAALGGSGIRVERAFTGRTNLHAEVAGVLTVDRTVIDRINRVDPAITVATLAEFAPVTAGQMVATVKIIPFAADGGRLAEAVALAKSAAVLAVAAYRAKSVGLVATELPSLRTSVMDKTRRLLEERLKPSGATLFREDRVAHEATAVAEAIAAQKRDGADLVIVFGASAVVDGEDVIPAAIRQAGGEVIRFGMPVDPGNLMVLGDLDGTPVIGAPGCARSPKENGFDWILNRLLAGLDVTSGDIAGLGVGGLLTEISSRPQPREGGAPAKKVAAIILAAGQSRRMGGPNKLLATIGKTPLVRIAAEAALASEADSVTVVTGHESAAVRSSLTGLDVAFVDNPNFANGLSTSLRAGVRSLQSDANGVLVMLGDMPKIEAGMIDRLIAAFRETGGEGIVVPTFAGRRGNPVVWSARFLPRLMAVTGDTGGREILRQEADAITEVELGPAVAEDVDTPEALARVGGTPA